ncbi:hypothetical protein Ocin01_03929 [Orchesella cincta]|uniref:Uncharacterized protein n=1 Tax=Orchesella cincta TaxID=48709 RepID=A0A1D2NBW8_ORCCI|nr:hypothetical protein Ocin01_03929 [Orchesella cincta]
MFPYGKKKIRVFPFRPTPDRGSFIDFIEETGTNAFLIEAVKKLYELPNKPENPIEWLRLHFKYLAPDRTKEMQETEELLKIELSEILINAHEEEAQNLEILTKLENEYKNITMASGKIYHYEDFRKYLHHPDDYHHRIKPDPLYQASKSDMLLPDEDRDSNLIIELVPFNTTKFSADASNRKVSDQHIYADYPSTYFPEKLRGPISPGGDEETDEDEGEEEEQGKGAEEKKVAEDEEGDEARAAFTEMFIGERSMTGAESIMGEATSSASPTTQQPQELVLPTSKKRRSTNETVNTKKTAKSQGKTKAPKIPKNAPTAKSKTRVPTREPSKAISAQIQRASDDFGEFIERDPLLDELEPVESSFWGNDFSVTGGLPSENLCDSSEHFDYEPVRLTENALKITAGSFRRFDETENEATEASKNCNNLGICNRNWIMDPNLVGPSFAEKLVYDGVPYDEEVAAEDAIEYYDDEDEDENEDNWNTSILSENADETNDECCESPSNCECECEESSCSTSYCHTSTSISSYKEDDNTVGRRTAPTPLESSGTDNEHRLEIEGEGAYEETMYNQTVAPPARFSENVAAKYKYK